LEISKVVAAEIGAGRTGIRISPVTPANDVSDSNPQPLFDYIVDHLNALKLVYIHVIEGATGGPRRRPDRLRQAVHRQPRSGRAPQEGRAAQHAGQGDVLWRRRQGLHGLSRARRGGRRGGLTRSLSTSSRGALATKQSSLPLWLWIASLRSQ